MAVPVRVRYLRPYPHVRTLLVSWMRHGWYAWTLQIVHQGGRHWVVRAYRPE